MLLRAGNGRPEYSKLACLMLESLTQSRVRASVRGRGAGSCIPYNLHPWVCPAELAWLAVLIAVQLILRRRADHRRYCRASSAGRCIRAAAVTIISKSYRCRRPGRWFCPKSRAIADMSRPILARRAKIGCGKPAIAHDVGSKTATSDEIWKFVWLPCL